MNLHREGPFASGLRVIGESVGHTWRHAFADHGDPCDCPPDLQRRWRGQRRLGRLLLPIRRVRRKALSWLEWQLGR